MQPYAYAYTISVTCTLLVCTVKPRVYTHLHNTGAQREYVHNAHTAPPPLLHIQFDHRIKKESVERGDEKCRDLGVEND